MIKDDYRATTEHDQNSGLECTYARFRADFWGGFRPRRPRWKWIPAARPAANYHSGNEYFVINFARFHCSNCEHFRPAGAKPHSATINYDGVMPHSIYYAARRMSCQIIPIRLQSGFVLLVRMFGPFEGSSIPAIFYRRGIFLKCKRSLTVVFYYTNLVYILGSICYTFYYL